MVGFSSCYSLDFTLDTPSEADGMDKSRARDSATEVIVVIHETVIPAPGLEFAGHERVSGGFVYAGMIFHLERDGFGGSRGHITIIA
jgi:hypothetical protein